MKRIFKRTVSLVLVLVMLATGFIHVRAAEIKAGDVDLDGNVTSADARLALRASVKLERLSADKSVNADADRDGAVTSADARLILRRSVNLETLASVSADEIKTVAMNDDERKPYESEDYELQYLSSVTAGGARHVILDDYVTLYMPTEAGTEEKDLLNTVGVVFNEAGEPFFILPNAEKRAQGIFCFDTLHFSLFGKAKLSDEKLLDLWAERAAAQSTVRRISEEDLTPGLAEMLTDCGLADNQYAGAVVRSILSLDTKGEILAAAIDGDGQTLRAKLVNLAGEYYLGKLFKQEEDKFLTQSLGDNADSVKKAVKDGKYREALTEIVKNIEKNVFSYVNYADKIASLTDKLADIWTDDMMNEQYEVYKKLGGASITDDDWNLVYMQLRGAANRLSSRGVSAADLRKKFEQRVKNEEKIATAKKELLQDAAEWRELGLMNTIYWYNSLGEYPSDTERLSSLRQIRETIRGLLTLDGKFQRGKNYMTDKDFLTDALFEWVTNGVKGRANFYKWLRDQGVYLPREDANPPGGDPSQLPFRVTPAEYPYRQHYAYMDDAAQLILNAGQQTFYKKGDRRTFEVTINDAGLDGDITVTGLRFSGSYEYGGWDNQTGSCAFEWSRSYVVQPYADADDDGKPPVLIARREEHTFTADKISVTDNGMQIMIQFTGVDVQRVYEERPREDQEPEMVLLPQYPIERKCDFGVLFTY